MKSGLLRYHTVGGSEPPASDSRCVIVNRANVRYVRVLPAVVVDHGTCRIEASRDLDYPFDKGILAGMTFFETGKPHALVDGHPSDDTGMIVVSAHHAFPFGQQSLLRFR